MSATERAAIAEAGRKADEHHAAPVPLTREEARRQLGWRLELNNKDAQCER